MYVENHNDNNGLHLTCVQYAHIIQRARGEKLSVFSFRPVGIVYVVCPRGYVTRAFSSLALLSIQSRKTIELNENNYHAIEISVG